jgi:hypothetical protein
MSKKERRETRKERRNCTVDVMKGNGKTEGWDRNSCCQTSRHEAQYIIIVRDWEGVAAKEKKKGEEKREREKRREGEI